MSAALDGDPHPKLLTVMSGGETLGIPISRVQTTFRIAAVTPIPLGPKPVIGLVNLRGAVIPALSLRRRLGMPDDSSHIGALAVGLDSGPDAFALIVDDVGDVITLEAALLQKMPPHVENARAAVTLALYNLAIGILPVLDVSALMAFRFDALELDALKTRRRPDRRDHAQGVDARAFSYRLDESVPPDGAQAWLRPKRQAKTDHAKTDLAKTDQARTGTAPAAGSAAAFAPVAAEAPAGFSTLIASAYRDTGERI